MDDDDWGDFDSAPTEPDSTNHGTATNNSMSNVSDTNDNNDTNGDDFGGFAEAEQKKEVANDDDFGDFAETEQTKEKRRQSKR